MASFDRQVGPAGVPVVQGYVPGGWRVSGILYNGGILVLPDRVEPLAALAHLAERDLSGVEVLLIGTGPTMTRPAPEVLAGTGVPTEFMDSRAAARTYNVLAAEGRRVAAVLLPL